MILCGHYHIAHEEPAGTPVGYQPYETADTVLEDIGVVRFIAGDNPTNHLPQTAICPHCSELMRQYKRSDGGSLLKKAKLQKTENVLKYGTAVKELLVDR